MSNRTKGILCMLASAMGFALMQILIAKTSSTIPIFEQIFFRNFIASIIAYVAIKRKKLSPFGKKQNRMLLTARSVFGYLGMLCMFYATANGNQGDVAILTKLSPFVVIVFSLIVFKEKISKYQMLAFVTAFFGAYITSNPHFSSDFMPTVAAILSSLFAGVAYSFVGMLKDREKPEVTVFWFSALSTIATIVLMSTNIVVPSTKELILLLGISIFATIGQLGITYAYTYAKASDVSIFNYSGIPFSMIFGLVFLGQNIKTSTVVGSILIVISGLIILFNDKKVNKKVLVSK